ncbi:pre-mRNA-splicing factor cwc24 [Nannizzia gypsea CBS 118893]|uniref:Pre-mRNA-splicing factor CWC24 n=1 Tax=Arthroderma gypseum (strain ATCC MYA-4604 / CBS 118893) TaxID=535722 RepID=E4USY6_ARTGP|nr:pre-mRNA-splicing factor cwc24 [Nannizzia gypsea CBS 118893]EFR00599.1 pre-mRNA-splicing factor cwc24 [Nannizzia gypsea CBS 118893]
MSDKDTVEQPVGEEQQIPAVSFKKRSAKAKSNLRKKVATPPPASDSDDFTSSDDEEGHRIKRRRKNAAVTASSKTAAASAGREQDDERLETTERPALPTTSDATKQSNWHDEELEKNLLGKTRARPGEADQAAPDGKYRGKSNYQNFIQKNPNAPIKQVGPMKAATNIRTITVTDYAPDVCKDYKRTGFCGFGDSCKYLHAREDYKAGWELDRDWDVQTKNGQPSSDKASESYSDRGRSDRRAAGNLDRWASFFP